MTTDSNRDRPVCPGTWELKADNNRYEFILFGVLGFRCLTRSALLEYHVPKGVWYIYDRDTG